MLQSRGRRLDRAGGQNEMIEPHFGDEIMIQAVRDGSVRRGGGSTSQPLTAPLGVLPDVRKGMRMSYTAGLRVVPCIFSAECYHQLCVLGSDNVSLSQIHEDRPPQTVHTRSY